MLKHGLEGINLNNPIEGKLPSIIEYFVKVYGEKYRDRIAERLNDTTFIFVDKFSSNRNKDIEVYFEKLKFKIFKSANDKLAAQTGRRLYQGTDYLTITQLDMVEKWKNHIEDDEIENVAKFLTHFVKVRPEQLRKALENGHDKEIYNFLSTFDEIYRKEIRENLLYLETEKEKYLALPENDNSVRRIEKNYEFKLNRFLYKKIISEFSIPDNEKNEKAIYSFLPTYLKTVKNNQEYLSKEDREDMTSFFEFLSSFNEDEIVATNNVYDYLNKPSIQAKLYSDEVKQEIRQLENEKNIELTPWLCERSKNTNPLYEEEFVFEEDIASRISEFSRNGSVGERTAAFIYPALSYSYLEKTKNVCVCGTYFNLYDSNIVHEMNHIIESDYSLKNGIFYQKTGFDMNQIPLGRGRATSNDCLLFNEVVNDYLSLKVLDLMQQDGFKIGYQTILSSTYAKAFPLLEGFIEDNLSDLVESRMSQDPSAFIQKIGKDNFSTLAKTTENYLNLLKVYSIDSVKQEIQTKLHIKGKLDLFEVPQSEQLSDNANLILGCFQNVKRVLKNIENTKETSDDENEI